MINKIKQIFSFGIPLFLTFSFFYITGYYNYYNVKILYFLNLQDIVLIFLNYIAPYLILLIFILCFYLSFQDYEAPAFLKKIWNFRLFRKIRPIGLLIFCIGIMILIISYYISVVKEFLILFLASITLIVLTIEITKHLSTKEDFKEIRSKNWSLMIFVIILYVMVFPYFMGRKTAGTASNNVKLSFNDNKILNTADSNSLEMIGKTENFLFIYNKKKKSTTAYKLSYINSIEISPKK